jgi:UDP-N-acetylmuramate--alanine ligase
MVGIKGTGMTALAEILHARGALITGSDVEEEFYTDRILSHLNITVIERFRGENITGDIKLVIYSSAYSKEENQDLKTAGHRGIPCITYPEALGILSRKQDSSGISGVHGKTTTTAMAGTIIKYLGFPATVIVGSEVPDFGNRSTVILGNMYLVAETCEYRRHFLHYKPSRIIITSIEEDHPDYFKDLEDMFNAFEEYGLSLPTDGLLIYNSDDTGASKVVKRIRLIRKDICLLPYGKSAEGDYRIHYIISCKGEVRFRLQRFDREFSLRIPGEHSAFNATAAIALAVSLLEKERGEVSKDDSEKIREALSYFNGSRRRSEILGEAAGILFMDDYAHHPTAVYKTLKGIRDFYPHRRLVVDFMAHTYSRTGRFLSDFGKCFEPADKVILHRIYASAREKDTGNISGEILFKEVLKHHDDVMYIDAVMDAAPFLIRELKEGDIFITMGAGDNWKVGKHLFARFAGEKV